MWLIQVTAKIGNGLWDNESGILFPSHIKFLKETKDLAAK